MQERRNSIANGLELCLSYINPLIQFQHQKVPQDNVISHQPVWMTSSYIVLNGITAGIILCMHPANGRRHYNVMSSVIGWVHSQNDPWLLIIKITFVLSTVPAPMIYHIYDIYYNNMYEYILWYCSRLPKKSHNIFCLCKDKQIATLIKTSSCCFEN